MNKTLEILADEYWYGGATDEGIYLPFTAGADYEVNLENNQFVNQVTTVFMSTKGRVIGSREAFRLKVKNNAIMLEAKAGKVDILIADEVNLKGAYHLAMSTYFPFEQSYPPMVFFTEPQFNTWIEFIYDQNQLAVLDYAREIIRNGYEPGILMIDDGWSDYYGKWTFQREKFPDPKKMVDQLHEMGFKVMLWVCPFISADTVIYRQLSQRNMLVKKAEGVDAIRQWWNGYSAILDMSNPMTVAWLDGQLKTLMADFGIDGFKFDAGDAAFYADSDCNFKEVTANEQSYLWAEYGARFAYNELRACFNIGGKALVQRLADKDHSWGLKGIASLIPNQLLQGLLGYPYSCPDMIGGGEYSNFLENSQHLDEELFIRYAQISALMPMMQFSAAPWRVLGKDNARSCFAGANLRKIFNDYLISLVKQTSKTGEPITRYMCYEFPDEQMEKIVDQFMLGSDYLVAPIIEKNSRSRLVQLPKGTWQFCDGTIYQGGQKVRVQGLLETLPYFKKLK